MTKQPFKKLIMNALKQEIYHEIAAFLEAYKAKNTYILKERFDIYGEFLEEIYEMLDFVENKNTLHICGIDDIDKQSAGQAYLEILDFDENSESPPTYSIECVLFMDNEDIGYIRGEYQADGSFPKFLFLYFSI